MGHTKTCHKPDLAIASRPLLLGMVPQSSHVAFISSQLNPAVLIEDVPFGMGQTSVSHSMDTC